MVLCRALALQAWLWKYELSSISKFPRTKQSGNGGFADFLIIGIIAPLASCFYLIVKLHLAFVHMTPSFGKFLEINIVEYCERIEIFVHVYDFKIMIFKILKYFNQLGKIFLARHLSKNVLAIARRNEREPPIARRKAASAVRNGGLPMRGRP